MGELHEMRPANGGPPKAPSLVFMPPVEMPLSWAFGQAPGANGRPMLMFGLSTPAGIFHVLIAPDAAERMFAQGLEQARLARAGLIPPTPN